MVKNPLHLHTTARVSDAEGPTGDQAFCSWGPICGSNQTPVGLVMGPLQDLHCLPTADCQLITVAGGEVVDYHRQLAPTRQLWGEKQGGEARWMLVVKPSVTRCYLFRIPGRSCILDEMASSWDFPHQEETISKSGSSGILELISNSACLCLCSKHTGCGSAGWRI